MLKLVKILLFKYNKICLLGCSARDSTAILFFSNVYVVVTFYPWFKFYFPWFWGMVIYGNDFEKKKITLKQRIKLIHNSDLSQIL